MSCGQRKRAGSLRWAKERRRRVQRLRRPLRKDRQGGRCLHRRAGRGNYIGVQLGFLGTNSTLVPAEIVRVNDRRRLIEIAAEAETIKHAPHFGNEETVSPELEDRVRTYFGLEPLLPPSDPYPPDDTGRFGPDDWVDTEPGERMEA